MAKKDYKMIANEVLQKVGGKENVKKVWHCATRLRFDLYDFQKADNKGVEAVNGVMGVVINQGLFQVVIGNDVPLVYSELTPLIGAELMEGEVEDTPDGGQKKLTLFDRAMRAMSGIFSPYIYILAAVGIMKGFLTLFTTLGWMDGTGVAYSVFYGASNAVFYFFPILLAFTAAKTFNANPYIGAVIAAATMEPTVVAIGEVGATVSFIGIPMVVYSFANTVFPIIIAMWFYSILYRFLMKKIPGSLKTILTTLICLVVMVPLTLLVFGPIGKVCSDIVGAIYSFLNNASPVLSMAFVGGFFIFVTMFGFNMVLIPMIVANIAATGTDALVGAWGLTNYAVMGVALAVMLKSKDKNNKAVASAGFLSLFLSGVSEPTLYGICIRAKRTFIPVIISGLIGGALYGAFGCYATNFGFTGILGLAVYISPKLPLYLLTVLVTVAVSAILTFLMVDFDKESQGEQSSFKLPFGKKKAA